MQRRSLNQLIDDYYSSSDSSDNDENYGILPFNENIPHVRNRPQNRRNNQSSIFNLPETASSTISDASMDSDGGNGYWTGNSRRSNNQSVRVNARLIYKDYCKAMVSFNIQSLSDPYLREFITNNNITIDTYRNHIRLQERNIGGLNGLKSMITPREWDSEECKACKQAFKIGCEAFLKYFAVNWVFAANIRNTQSYLRHRFRLLRKIKDLTL